MDAAQALDLVKKLTRKLEQRRPDVDRFESYYRGGSGGYGLKYASGEFSSFFARRFDGFSDNWARPVTDAAAERLNVLGIRIGVDSREADADMGRVWQANDADRGSSEAFVSGLAMSRAFALVWGNAEDPETPQITWEHPADCIVGYDSDTGESVAGLKTWRDDGYEFATLYTESEVWKWQRRVRTSQLVIVGQPADGGNNWEMRQPPSDDVWPLPNPIGEVPLVELRNQGLLRAEPLSDISGVTAMQDAINLVWAYLFNSMDFASLPQRVVLGQDVPEVPILDEAGQVVGKRKLDLNRLMQQRVLWLTKGDAKIDSWPAADLEVFSKVIEQAVEHVAAQTKTPPHYLLGKMVNTAAEALTAAEAGLVSKVFERQTYFTRPVKQIHRLVALAQGDEAKAAAALSGTVLWKDPQYRSRAQLVDALVKLRGIGFPLEWIAEQYGLAPAEVARVMSMVQGDVSRVLAGDASSLFGPKPPPSGAPDMPMGGPPDAESLAPTGGTAD